MDGKRNDKGLPIGTFERLKVAQNSFCEELIIAGFGGQGIILAGRLLAQTAMNAGKEVTFMPSYGAEVRGGTANSMIVISDEPIASPLVSRPDSLIAMNKASLNKFAPCIKTGGLLIMNSSLIDSKPNVDQSIDILAVPADDIAVELGSQKSANMVVLGAYLQRRGLFRADDAAKSLPDILAKRYHKTLNINAEALQHGAEFAKRSV
ncbi:MAG: 2-oxoacid:acceptor oxidoreductase family protein [Phycisphaerae bacterium]|nr:2-oxoacid:acceptor oxidoreductase family protein [Phycisphaerae bacterium]